MKCGQKECRCQHEGTVVVDEWDLEAIETAARRMAMHVAARVVEQRLNADTSDHAGPMLPCACGQSARYAGRHGSRGKDRVQDSQHDDGARDA